MSWFDENGYGDHVFQGPVVDQAPAPSGQTVEEIAAKIRAGGGSEHVANDEAAYLASKYSGADLDRVISESMGSYLARSAPGSGGGGAAPAASGGSAAFASGAPAAISPFTKQFTAPTMEQVQNSPGFKFRLGEGQKALERSAAARGTLLTGGTAKAINAFGQDFASNEYDKAYGRAIGEHQQDFGIHQWNEGNRYNTQRTNRMDDFGIFDNNRRFDRGVFESDRGFNFGKEQFEYGKGRDSMNDWFRFADYGFNSARNNPAY